MGKQVPAGSRFVFTLGKFSDGFAKLGNGPRGQAFRNFSKAICRSKGDMSIRALHSVITRFLLSSFIMAKCLASSSGKPSMSTNISSEACANSSKGGISFTEARGRLRALLLAVSVSAAAAAKSMRCFAKGFSYISDNFAQPDKGASSRGACTGCGIWKDIPALSLRASAMFRVDKPSMSTTIMSRPFSRMFTQPLGGPRMEKSVKLRRFPTTCTSSTTAP
mmetsp:Transcript_41018/g.95776  ORF Transcript_41018/g.95776 Transcript_41018/m.95776 type:complete len:221 (+) Transcript_41018:901-1563(+)